MNEMLSSRLQKWRRIGKKHTRYCQLKGSCPEKRIKKSAYTKGVYYIVCGYYPELCNQQTANPQKITLATATSETL